MDLLVDLLIAIVVSAIGSLIAVVIVSFLRHRNRILEVLKENFWNPKIDIIDRIIFVVGLVSGILMITASVLLSLTTWEMQETLGELQSELQSYLRKREEALEELQSSLRETQEALEELQSFLEDAGG